MGILYPGGQVDVAVSDKIAIFTEGRAQVYYKYDKTSIAPAFRYSSDVNNQEVVLTPGSSVGVVRIYADLERVYYETGSAPTVSRKDISKVDSPANIGESVRAISVVRNTIADAGTITVAQMRDQVLYQDASGGAVTCTTPTGTLLAAEFADLAVGNAVSIFHASNHATNTSTISGGTDVTLVGSGAVTNTGGQYLLVKTAATTFDLVRVG